MRTITTVKNEIRILGLDSCAPHGVIGVVVRGGLFQDGVLFFAQKKSPSGEDVVDRIVETKYFPELRSIMIHDPAGRLDSARIEQKTRLPVIEVSEVKPMSERGYRLVYGKRADLWVKTRLRTMITEKILSTTWTMGRLPEPVRAAHILSKTIRKRPRRDKG